LSSYQWPPQSGSGGGGVTSLNTETGDLTIVAGSGITVTPSGTNITIAATGSSGTVTSLSIVSANGLAGIVANPTTTPAVTLSTTITGILQGNGTAISAYTGGNLTDVGTDGITITGGTGAVIGSGTSISQHVADTTHNGYLSSTDWNTFNGKQASGNYITALTGDGTASGPGSAALTLSTVNSNIGTFASVAVNGKGLVTAAAALSGDATTSGSALTLATVNSNVGSFGTSTAIPSFTVNAKGLLTAASTNVVIAPAGTLTGTTLASNVVSSSLTSVGTITSGTWTGTTIAIANGGTGQTTASAAFSALSPITTTGDMIYSSSGTTNSRLAIGSSGQVLTVSGGVPSWQAPTSGTFKFYASSQVTNLSSGISSGTFTTFSNSPALTFTPTITGTYKIYSNIPINNGSSNGEAVTRIFNTTGSATLLYESQGVSFGGSQVITTAWCQSVYTLNSGTSYVFDIQAKALSGTVYAAGGDAAFYMFGELCG